MSVNFYRHYFNFLFFIILFLTMSSSSILFSRNDNYLNKNICKIEDKTLEFCCPEKNKKYRDSLRIARAENKKSKRLARIEKRKLIKEEKMKMLSKKKLEASEKKKKNEKILSESKKKRRDVGGKITSSIVGVMFGSLAFVITSAISGVLGFFICHSIR